MVMEISSLKDLAIMTLSLWDHVTSSHARTAL